MIYPMAFIFFIAFAGSLCGSATFGIEIKNAIAKQQEMIAQAGADEKGAAIEALALLYLKDQDQERAFKTFLEALNHTKARTQTAIVDLDEYNQAFALYLNGSSRSPQETAEQLIGKLLPILEKEPKKYLLDYFVAIAYANLGKYEEFFKHFYSAYPFYPDHYLAYKTKAILQIKLLERTRGDSERAAERQRIMENLLLAMEREPLDTTIYKLLISFSPKEKKKDQVQLCLKKIINGNIMIPRSELMFYVIEAVDMNEIEWCQRFISCLKEWYPQSRLVASAEEYAHKQDTHKLGDF